MVRTVIALSLGLTALAPPTLARADDPVDASVDDSGADLVDHDVIAEKAAIRQEGKRMIIAGWACLGAALTMTGVSVSLVVLDMPYAGVGVASGGLVTAVASPALLAAGGLRIKHPERYMKQRRVAVAPSVSRRHVGATFALHF
jgi:hypothetical protein